jgi:hypothetical protein
MSDPKTNSAQIIRFPTITLCGCGRKSCPKCYEQWRPATKEEIDATYRKLQREAVEGNPFHVR